mgnify:CR=1 FL=1
MICEWNRMRGLNEWNSLYELMNRSQTAFSLLILIHREWSVCLTWHCWYTIVYTPQKDDCVIGVITQRFADEYEVDINSAYTGRLNIVAFEGATKRNHPVLKVSPYRFIHHTGWRFGLLSSPSDIPWNATRSDVYHFKWTAFWMGEWVVFVWSIIWWIRVQDCLWSSEKVVLLIHVDT